MKMNSAQIERTLEQFEGKVVPEDNPVVQRLKQIFGDHTYFLDESGLNIVEPAESDRRNVRLGAIVNIADWTDTSWPTLAPHDPEKTGFLVPHDPEKTGLLVLL